MKILYHIPFPQGLGDDRTIYEGYRFAFEDLGHQVIPLTEADDLEQTLAASKPDIFISSFSIIDPKKNFRILKAYRDQGGKILLKGGILDERDQGPIDLVKHDLLADVYAGEMALPRFERITGKPFRILPLAASRQYHFPAQPSAKYQCDIIFIGARLAKKEDLFRRRLLPLVKKYHVKIFGLGWDALDRYLLKPFARLERSLFTTGVISSLRNARQVPWDEENIAYASAKICLNFHEQQEGDLFLLNGRTFKIPASGGFEICDYVPVARDYFNEDELVMVKDDADFFKKVDYYLTHESERRAIQEKGTRRALRDHTYYNRARLILDWLKLT